MPRVLNCTGVLNRASEITFDLMKERGVLDNPDATSADVLPLMPEVNERVHTEFPEFATGEVELDTDYPLHTPDGKAWDIFLWAVVNGVHEEQFGATRMKS